MYNSFEKYIQHLPPEINFLRLFLSHISTINAANFERYLVNLDPQQLLKTLKNHRLYPPFYKIWQNYLSNPYISNNWQQFSTLLKDEVKRNSMQMLQKTSTLANIAALFKEQNIPLIALKGPSLASQLYNDVAMKASIDIDILVPRIYYKQAYQILLSMGFGNMFTYKLTPRKEQYLLNNFHHIALYGPLGKVELHWELNTNRYMTGRRLDYYFANTQQIDIAGKAITVLNQPALVEYLAIHGSYHAWARLDWLYDFSSLILQNPDSITKNETLSFETGNQKILYQSLVLANLFFNSPMPVNAQAIPHSLIKIPVEHISKPFFNSKKQGLTRLFQKLYIFRLKSNIAYRFKIFSVLGTNQGDWEMLHIPDRFFFLYFLLRPFLYIRNFIKKPIK